MTHGLPLSRRTVLASGAAGGAVLGTGLVAAPASAAAADVAAAKDAYRRSIARVRAGRRSANGWEVEKAADAGGAVWTTAFAGSAASAALHVGDVSAVLGHVVRRWNYEIDTLAAGEVAGWRASPSGGPEGNHASGTAVDIRPGWYPPGAAGGLFPHELAVVRDILRECRGVVAWGGDAAQPHESHFEIAVPPGDARLAALAAALRTADATPGQGPGTLTLRH